MIIDPTSKKDKGPRRTSIMDTINQNNLNLKRTVDSGSGSGKIAKWRLPSSKFRAFWETLNFTFYMLNAFLIPARIIFGTRKDFVEPVVIIAPAIVFQSTFFVDLIFRSFIFAHEKQGE